MNPGMTSRFAFVLAILAAFAGAWASGMLLTQRDGGWTHSTVRSESSLGLCKDQLLPNGSCPAITRSRWSAIDVTIFGRYTVIPTSLIGLSYFACMLIWLSLVFRPHYAGRWVRWTTYTGLGVSTCVSLLLMAEMVIHIGQWCSSCALVHACNLAVVIAFVIWCRLASKTNLPESASDASTSSLTQPRLILTGALACTISVAGIWFYYAAMTEARRQWRKADHYASIINPLKRDEAFVLREYLAQPIETSGADNTVGLGASEDKLSAIVYSNYDCPGCACFAMFWDRVTTEMAVDMSVSYRFLPPGGRGDADSRTSTSERQQSHARAACAAKLQGGTGAFHAMERLLYRASRKNEPTDYAELARQIGLDETRFAIDMNGPTVSEQLTRDAELARRLGVTSAPAVFLNGRRVPELCLTSTVFWKAIGRRDSADSLASASNSTGAGDIEP